MLCAHAIIICCTMFLLSRSFKPSYDEMDLFWHVRSRLCLHCVPGQLPGQLQETAEGAPCTAKWRSRMPEIVQTRSHDTKSHLKSHYPNMFHHVLSGKCLGLVVPQCPTIKNNTRHHDLRKVSAPSMLPGWSLHFSRSSRSIVSTASSCLTLNVPVFMLWNMIKL